MKKSLIFEQAESITDDEYKHLGDLFADSYELKIKKTKVAIPTKLDVINDIFGVHISLKSNKDIALIDFDCINDNEIIYDASKHHQVKTLLKRLRGVCSHSESVKHIERDGKAFYLLQNLFKGKIMLRGVIAIDIIDDFAKSIYNQVLTDIK